MRFTLVYDSALLRSKSKKLPMALRLVDVDPRFLKPNPSRPFADPAKLARQIAKYGSSKAGMPPIVAYESEDGRLVVYNGVTRATRMAMLAPGVTVPVEVIGRILVKFADKPSIGDTLP